MSPNHVIVLLLSVFSVISFVYLIIKFKDLEPLVTDQDVGLLILGMFCMSCGLFAAIIAGLRLLLCHPAAGHAWANWGSALLTFSIISFLNPFTRRYRH